MGVQNLAHWSGPTLMLGGLLLAIHYLTRPLGETSTFILTGVWVPVHFIGSVAWVLILLGSAGVYSQYSRRLSHVGSICLLLAFIGGANKSGVLMVVCTVISPLIAAQTTSLLDARSYLH